MLRHGRVCPMHGRVLFAGITIVAVGCRAAGPTSTAPSSTPLTSARSRAPAVPAPSNPAATANSIPCQRDYECGAGLVCFRHQCQEAIPCSACPPDAYCDQMTPWCQSCPDPADGPVTRDFDFEGLRYHVEARRAPVGKNAFLPAVDVTVTSADGQRHGIHRASAFTHASHTNHSWGTLGANAPRNGVPDTCLGPGDKARLTFDLSSRGVEVHAEQHLEVTYGVLTGECTTIRARVHVVTVRLDWSCKTPAFWIVGGPEKPAGALENRPP